MKKMVKYLPDYYSILNINETADKKTIKEAYTKSIIKYRSDSVKNSEQKCKYVKDAYLVLSDDKKRAKYDLLRKKAQENKKEKKEYEDKKESKEDLDKIKDLLSDMNKKSGRNSKIFGTSAKAMKGKSLFGGGSKLLMGNGMKLLIGGAIAGYGAKKGRDYIQKRQGKNINKE